MKILVTGSKGMVASHLREEFPNAIFLQRKYTNLVYSNQTNYAIATNKPDIVIHIASKVGSMVDNMNHKYDYMYENMLINMNIINACKTFKIPKLIAVSSTCSYPDILDESMYPMKEDCIHLGKPTDTSIGYAYSKRMLQLAIDLCNEQYGTEYNYIIPCNIFSEYDCHKDDRMHFMTRLLRKLVKTKDAKMDGSGEAYRQYIYGGDFAKIIRNHVENNVNQSYNIAGDNLKLSEWAEKTLDVVNDYHSYSEKATVTFANKIPVGQFRKDVDISRFKSIYPDFKFTDYKESVRKVYDKYVEEQRVL